MDPTGFDSQLPIRASCCPCGHSAGATHAGTTRREFLAAAGGFGLIGTALAGIAWDKAQKTMFPRRPRSRVVGAVFQRRVWLCANIA